MIKQNVFVLLGPPGAGKGTLAATLAAKYHCTPLATGDVFRRHVHNKTPLGLRVSECLRAGQYAPDDLTNEVVSSELATLAKQSNLGSLILDGYPRTKAQAEYLAQLVDVKTAFLLTTANVEVIVGRLSGRRICPTCAAIYHLTIKPPKVAGRCDHDDALLVQRKDDAPDVVRTRFNTYDATIQPLIAYYAAKHLLVTLDATKTTAELAAQVAPYMLAGGKA